MLQNSNAVKNLKVSVKNNNKEKFDFLNKISEKEEYDNEKEDIDDQQQSNRKSLKSILTFGLKNKLKKTILKSIYTNKKLQDKIYLGFPYSIPEIFYNSNFNMNRLRITDFTSLNQYYNTKKKELKSLRNKQTIKKYIDLVTELKNEVKLKKIEIIKGLAEPGKRYFIININSNISDDSGLNSLKSIRFSNEEIEMAKMCILNKWIFPPYNYLLAKAIEAESHLKYKSESLIDMEKEIISKPIKKTTIKLNKDSEPMLSDNVINNYNTNVLMKMLDPSNSDSEKKGTDDKKRKANKNKSLNSTFVVEEKEVQKKKKTESGKFVNNLFTNNIVIISKVYNFDGVIDQMKKRKNTNDSITRKNTSGNQIQVIKKDVNSNEFNLETMIVKNPVYRLENGKWIDPDEFSNLFTDLVLLHNTNFYRHKLHLNFTDIDPNNDIFTFNKARFVIKLEKCQVITEKDKSNMSLDEILSTFYKEEYYDESYFKNNSINTEIYNLNKENDKLNDKNEGKEIKDKKNISNDKVKNSLVSNIAHNNSQQSYIFSNYINELYSNKKKFKKSFFLDEENNYYTNKIDSSNRSLLINLHIKNSPKQYIGNLGIFFELYESSNDKEAISSFRLKNDYSSYQFDLLDNDKDYLLIMKSGFFPFGYSLDLLSDHKLILMSYEEYIFNSLNYNKKSIYCNYTNLTKGHFMHLRKIEITIYPKRKLSNKTFNNNNENEKSIFYFSLRNVHSEYLKSFIEIMSISGKNKYERFPLNERIEINLNDHCKRVSKTVKTSISNNLNEQNDIYTYSSGSDYEKEDSLFCNDFLEKPLKFVITVNANPYTDYEPGSFYLDIYSNHTIETNFTKMIIPYEIADKMSIKKNSTIFQEMIFCAKTTKVTLCISFKEYDVITDKQYSYLFEGENIEPKIKDQFDFIQNTQSSQSRMKDSNRILSMLNNTKNSTPFEPAKLNGLNSEFQSTKEYKLELILDGRVLKSWIFINKITIFDLYISGGITTFDESMSYYSKNTKIKQEEKQEKNIKKTKDKDKDKDKNFNTADILNSHKGIYTLKCSLLNKDKLDNLCEHDKNKFWIIKIFSEETIAFVKDIRKDEYEQFIINQWENEEKGRIKKAEISRKVFNIKEKLDDENNSYFTKEDLEFLKTNSKELKKLSAIDQINPKKFSYLVTNESYENILKSKFLTSANYVDNMKNCYSEFINTYKSYSLKPNKIEFALSTLNKFKEERKLEENSFKMKKSIDILNTKNSQLNNKCTSIYTFNTYKLLYQEDKKAKLNVSTASRKQTQFFINRTNSSSKMSNKDFEFTNKNKLDDSLSPVRVKSFGKDQMQSVKYFKSFNLPSITNMQLLNDKENLNSKLSEINTQYEIFNLTQHKNEELEKEKLDKITNNIHSFYHKYSKSRGKFNKTNFCEYRSLVKGKVETILDYEKFLHKCINKLNKLLNQDSVTPITNKDQIISNKRKSTGVINTIVKDNIEIDFNNTSSLIDYNEEKITIELVLNFLKYLKSNNIFLKSEKKKILIQILVKLKEKEIADIINLIDMSFKKSSNFEYCRYLYQKIKKMLTEDECIDIDYNSKIEMMISLMCKKENNSNSVDVNENKVLKNFGNESLDLYFETLENHINVLDSNDIMLSLIYLEKVITYLVIYRNYIKK